MNVDEKIEEARSQGRYVAVVMQSRADRVDVTYEVTEGVNLALGCAALVKGALGRLDKAAERNFLEQFVKELRS